MVGPISDDERLSAFRKLKATFVVLVGASAGLISLQGDVGPLGFAGATAAGLLVGLTLVRFAFPDSWNDPDDPPRWR